jgi:hypothetical protein
MFPALVRASLSGRSWTLENYFHRSGSDECHHHSGRHCICAVWLWSFNHSKEMSSSVGFNPPSQDPRTPDIIVQPNVGVIYTTSKRKLEGHGGFAHDDTNVIMLVSNPTFTAKTVTGPVETMQVAPTVLKAWGANPSASQAVKIDGTQVLPELKLDIDDPNN